MKIEGVYRTAGPFAIIALQGDEDSRPSVFFDDSRSDNADHSGMPAVARENNPVGLRGLHVLEHLARLIEGLVVELLTLRVELFELSRNCVRRVLVVAHEELDAAHRVAHPAGRVQPGRQNESHATGRHELALKARCPDHRPQADVAR